MRACMLQVVRRPRSRLTPNRSHQENGDLATELNTATTERCALLPAASLSLSMDALCLNWPV